MVGFPLLLFDFSLTCLVVHCFCKISYWEVLFPIAFCEVPHWKVKVSIAFVRFIIEELGCPLLLFDFSLTRLVVHSFCSVSH